jgi:RNAse (barnase) inhibitor barstar
VGLSNLFKIATVDELFQIIQNDFALQDEYIKTIDAVIRFLQGKIQPWRFKYVRKLLPEASRFAQLEELGGSMGTQDK